MDIRVPQTLETKRLWLRQFENSDWIDLHKYYSNPSATAFTTGRAFSEGETWRAMAGMVGHWQLHGYGPYAVVEKASNSVLGTVGFWYPNDWPAPEIKWALAPEYWGRGFAKEATLAVQEAAREYLSDLPLISFIHAQNMPSISLAQAVGATFEKEVEFRGGIWHIYRHPSVVQSSC